MSPGLPVLKSRVAAAVAAVAAVVAAVVLLAPVVVPVPVVLAVPLEALAGAVHSCHFGYLRCRCFLAHLLLSAAVVRGP